jgi:hypothetical protein
MADTYTWGINTLPLETVPDQDYKLELLATKTKTHPTNTARLAIFRLKILYTQTLLPPT